MNNSQPPSSPNDNLPVVRVVVGDPNSPAIELTRLPANVRLRKPISLPQGLGTVLLPLLREAPSMAMAATNMLHTTYLLKFSPDVAMGLQRGSLSLMQSLDGGIRAMAVDGRHRIVGNGSLITASGATPAMAVGLVWQTLAVVTAQRYLVDISHRLTAIEKAIADVRVWIERDHFSALSASLSYLQTVAVALLEPHISESEMAAFLGEIEGIYRDTGRITATFRDELRRATASMGGANAYAMNVDGTLNHITTSLEHFSRSGQGFLTAVLVKAVACRVRLALPASRQISLSRISELRREVEDIEAECKSFVAAAREFFRVPQQLPGNTGINVLGEIARLAFGRETRIEQLREKFTKFEEAVTRSTNVGAVLLNHVTSACTLPEGESGSPVPLAIAIQLDEKGAITVAHNVLP